MLSSTDRVFITPNLFDTDQYLGYAGQPGLVGFFGCATSRAVAVLAVL